MLAGCPVTELLRRWAEGLRGPPCDRSQLWPESAKCLPRRWWTYYLWQDSKRGTRQSAEQEGSTCYNLGPRARRKEKCSAFGLRLQRLSSKVSLKTPSASRLHWDRWMQGCPQGNPAWETDCPAHLRLAWEKWGDHVSSSLETRQSPRASKQSPSGVNVAGGVMLQQPQSHAGPSRQQGLGRGRVPGRHP